jgi:hypothetical protein
MSKARVNWAFQERPVSSTKMNQANTDYITPGLPIWSYWFKFNNDSGGLTGGGGVGYYPYNPQKSVYDRLYIFGGAFTSSGGDETDEFDVTFNGGASWTPAFPSLTASPVGLVGAFTLAETWDLDVQVATFQWIGWRWSGPGPTSGNEFILGFQGFLYRSTDTPF